MSPIGKTAARAISSSPIIEAHEPLAARMARERVRALLEDLPGEVIEKVKPCLLNDLRVHRLTGVTALDASDHTGPLGSLLRA